MTLVTHDWGGIVGWYFVLLEPQLVDAYVVMNSSHPIAYQNTLIKSISQLKKGWSVYLNIIFTIWFMFKIFIPRFHISIDEFANKPGTKPNLKFM